jgi:amidohydrolase
VLRRLEELSRSIASGLGCEVDLIITKLTPPVENDRGLAESTFEVAKAMYPDFEIDQVQRTMGSEDMAYMMETVPGFYLFLGSNNVQEGLNAAHHSPYFDFDETALPVGVAVLSGLAIRMLSDYQESV